MPNQPIVIIGTYSSVQSQSDEIEKRIAKESIYSLSNKEVSIRSI